MTGKSSRENDVRKWGGFIYSRRCQSEGASLNLTGTQNEGQRWGRLGNYEISRGKIKMGEGYREGSDTRFVGVFRGGQGWQRDAKKRGGYC